MSSLEILGLYVDRLVARLRFAALARGLGITACIALTATVAAVLAANAQAFSRTSLIAGRTALLLALALAVGFGLIWPLLKATRGKAARTVEKKHPEFEQRLITYTETSAVRPEDPFLELLSADTVTLTKAAEPRRIVGGGLIVGWLSSAGAAAAVLVWLILAGPGFWGHGAALLWGASSRTGSSPFYEIVVEPGDRTVRQGATQLVTARLVGFQSQAVKLLAQYRGTTKWEEALMVPEEGTGRHTFLFAGISQTVDYYVASGAVRSRAHTLTVVDLPSVRRIRVSYTYPAWTGLKPASEDPGGDVRAVEGTEVQVAVETDRPLNDGALVLDGGDIELRRGEGNWRHARMTIRKDGSYYIAGRHEGELVRLTDDYFIEALRDEEPLVRIARPGRDARVSPIEEVTVVVQANDDFGLHNLMLHYSVNGGEEQTAPLLSSKGDKEAEGTATIYLEDFKLSPGDVVAVYASARDARVTARTDMYFLEAQPYEREFSQSQQMDSGGGGGGGEGDNAGRISQRQKEIIAATWNQLRDRSPGRQQAQENAKFLTEVQTALRNQARSLAERMGRRELSGTNEEFSSFSKDMLQAAEAMGPAAERLKAGQWQEALPHEQKALQHLLRAESTFRRIQVAFGNRGGGGGGGGGGSARDLESLFDLELDTEMNQYEVGQRAATGEQRNREVEEALQKLQELARRQQELAQQQSRQQQFQQRWQQEMLRREAEQLQRRLEQLSRGGSQQQSSSQAQGQPSQSGSSSATAGRAQSGQQRQQTDPRIEQALRRLQEATQDMRRAGDRQEGAGQMETRRAADRLREASELMRGMRQQQSADSLDDVLRQAEAMAEQQRQLAERMSRTFGAQAQAGGPPNAVPALTPEQIKQSREMATERQRMVEDLERLERDMKSSARDLSSSQRTASARLREALGDLQQQELALRMRYNAELLRRGMGALASQRERPITEGLENLRDQLRQAQAALGRTPAGQEDARQTLAQLESLRNRLERLTERQQAGQRGQEAQGQGEGGRGWRGQESGREAGGGQRTREETGVQGGWRTPGPRSDDFSAMNTGERRAPTGGVEPRFGSAADMERLYRESISDLQQLRGPLSDDPQASVELHELIRQMQSLDPSRFPGNPEILARMHQQVLPMVQQLELRLRRKLDDDAAGVVRSGAREEPPAGYADAVAEYFRRLSRGR